MHDIRLIRDEPDAFDAAMALRGLPPQAARLIELDAARRTSTGRLQELETQRNARSKEIGKAKAQGDEARFNELRAEVDQLKSAMEEAAEAARTAEDVLNQHLAALPNRPASDVPQGKDETENEEVRRWGEPRAYDFEVKDHVSLGEQLGLDFERAAAMSGARFAVLHGPLARLERALSAFMLDLHTSEHGYRETSVPYMVRDEALFGTGQLPKFAEDLFEVKTSIAQRKEDIKFRLERIRGVNEGIARSRAELSELGNFARNIADKARAANDLELLEYASGLLDRAEPSTQSIKDNQENADAVLANIEREVQELERSGSARAWLIPTAEVPLTNLMAGAIHAEGDFPIRMTAHTPCFRSEAGSAGRDTRGLIRMHQFHKVELVSVTTPENSDAELERMTTCAEEVLRRLELPYRVMKLCTGDMGFAAQRTFDLEVWMPSQNIYREISSCSTCGDFQARRMNARFRREGEKKPDYLHTLNGSGVAVGRALVGILENHQNADGSVTIPAALRGYMGGLERLTP
jgi:seryl-tRNA synthetase